MWDRALAHWRTLATDDDADIRPRGHARLRRARAADHLGHRSEPGASAFPAACPIRPAMRSEPARRRRKRARLYGTAARHGARRPAGQSRLHRLVHQQPAARPRSRRRRGARPARRRRRRRHGGARLVDGEARGGSGGPRPRVPRRRFLLGRIRLLDVRRRQRRPRRAGRALRLHHQPQFREPPGPEGAHASASARRPPRRPPSPAASPTCGNCCRERA